MPTHTLGTQPWPNPSRSDGRALRGHGSDSGSDQRSGHSVGEEPKRATTELSKKGTVPRTGRERTLEPHFHRYPWLPYCFNLDPDGDVLEVVAWWYTCVLFDVLER